MDWQRLQMAVKWCRMSKRILLLRRFNAVGKQAFHYHGMVQWNVPGRLILPNRKMYELHIMVLKAHM